MAKPNEGEETTKAPRKHKLYCKFMSGIGKLIFKKRNVCYERTPEENEVAIFACNHSGMVGPVNMCAWFDRPFSPWSICYLFDKEVSPNYIYHDFFFGRSKKHKKFYRGLSKIVAKLLPPLLLAFKPIKVYHNSCSIIHTFKESVATLAAGKTLSSFPNVRLNSASTFPSCTTDS